MHLPSETRAIERTKQARARAAKDLLGRARHVRAGHVFSLPHTGSYTGYCVDPDWDAYAYENLSTLIGRSR